MAHRLQQPYSGKNPVPKIATQVSALVNPKKATDAKARQLEDSSGQQEQKETQKTAQKLAKGKVMHVKDPVTGEETDIRNADDEPDLTTEGDNVLRHAFPPPDLDEHRKKVVSVTRTSILAISAAYLLSSIVSRMLFTSFTAFSLLLVPPSIFAYCLLFRMHKVSENDFLDRAWHSERERGLEAGTDLDGDGTISDDERTRESTEWLNAALAGVWPIVNADLFGSVVDMVEDIMQSSAPSFVHSVRISDMGLGSNPARITAIRSLPDVPSHEKDYEDEDRQDSVGSSMQVDTSSLTDDDRDSLDGNHVNLEVSFAYRGMPSGQSASSKAKNIHLLVEFFPGMKGVFGVKFPVWVEVTGATGVARVRMQFISNPPFVKTTMVTLMGLPNISISVVPMSEKLPNVMNIPFISGFVESAINTAAAEYVAPKSLMLDLQKLISGDDIKKDTEAIGVIVVHIHRATGLKSMDDNGKSDPYVTLTYSRLEKPLYSTRIVKKDLNPVFEETAVVMVDVNTVKLREKLSFQLWDSDRVSMDDMLGFHEISIVDLIRQRGKPVRRVSPLTSPDSRNRPGSVEYTVGYYGKLPPNGALSTDGSDPGIPDDLRDKPEFKQARAVALDDLEAAVLVTPPDPEWPSGVLSVQVHEIRDLTVRTAGKDHGRSSQEGEKGQEAGEQAQEEGEGLPSSYCTVSLNDELVYETRVKPITSSPMFNAGAERFVRDWRKSHVSVTVKDSRMRENDAVLGIVLLNLTDVFVNASEVTRFYSIQEGVGHGRVRVSLLWRPVDAKLPPNLLGFDTGTLEIRDIAVRSQQDFSDCEVRLKTTTSPAEEKVSRKSAHKRDSGEVVWSHQDATQIPVRMRYGAALLVSFKEQLTLSHGGRKALGVLWLRDIIDNEEGAVEIALWHAKHADYSRLKLNYAPPDGNLSCWDSDKEKFERIGTVLLDLAFRPGLSKRHHELLSGAGAKKRGAWDEYDREEAGGMRESIGEMDEQMPNHHHSMAGKQTQESDGHIPGHSEHEHTETGGPINSEDGDDRHIVEDDGSVEGTNTVVSSGAAENESPDEGTLVGAEGESEHADVEDAGESHHEEHGGKGPIKKLKEWRQHEKELHRDHRGIMQTKPARTAEWMKDNVEEGAHALASRFKMKSRQPDVETEA